MIEQIGIIAFGVPAIWLVGRRESWRRYGYLCGLIGQIFWFWATVKSGQWGIFALAIWYTYAWAQGLKNHWNSGGAA